VVALDVRLKRCLNLGQRVARYQVCIGTPTESDFVPKVGLRREMSSDGEVARSARRGERVASKTLLDDGVVSEVAADTTSDDAVVDQEDDQHHDDVSYDIKPSTPLSWRFVGF